MPKEKHKFGNLLETFDHCYDLKVKLAAANQEITLLKGKLDKLKKYFSKPLYLTVPEIEAILTPSPKEGK